MYSFPASMDHACHYFKLQTGIFVKCALKAVIGQTFSAQKETLRTKIFDVACTNEGCLNHNRPICKLYFCEMRTHKPGI